MGCMSVRSSEDKQCSVCGFDLEEYKMAPHLLRPETILNGKYLVGRVLGEGGFGITYIGWDLNLEIKIAIKEYYPSGFVTRESTALGSGTVAPFAGDKGVFYEQGLERFIREAKSLAKFYNLSGIVSVKDFFRENGTAYIVMEFVDGVTLKQHLQQCGGRIEPKTVCSIMKPLIKSLNTVHKEGIIHRDISPDNIMVTAAGDIKLIDFGAARNFSGNENRSLSVLLKPGYAPEEQYRTKGNQGPWTDVYSLCATIYKVLTGDTPPEALERYQMDSIVRPSALGIDISSRMEDAIIKGLSVFQKDRFQTVLELEDAMYGDTQAEGLYNKEQQDIEKLGEDMPQSINKPQEEKVEPVVVSVPPNNGINPYPSSQYSSESSASYPYIQPILNQENSRYMGQNYAEQNYAEQNYTAQNYTGQYASVQKCDSSNLKRGKRSKKIVFLWTGIVSAVLVGIIVMICLFQGDSIDASSSFCFYGEKGLTVNLKGKTTKRISTNSCWDIVANDGWIYYSNFDDNGYLYKIKTNGKEGGRISRDSCGNIVVVDDTIYYSNGSDGYALYKIETDGSRKEKISDTICFGLQVEEDYIYYTDLGTQENTYNLCRMELDGENPIVLSQADSALFKISGDYLYFAYLNGKGVARLKYGSDTPEDILSDEVINMFDIDQDYIYYGTTEGIFKANLDGSNIEQITEDQVVAMNGNYEDGETYKTESNLYLDEDWIYYWNESDHGYLYKIKSDGTGRKCISKEASVFGRIEALK